MPEHVSEIYSEKKIASLVDVLSLFLEVGGLFLAFNLATSCYVLGWSEFFYLPTAADIGLGLRFWRIGYVDSTAAVASTSTSFYSFWKA